MWAHYFVSANSCNPLLIASRNSVRFLHLKRSLLSALYTKKSPTIYDAGAEQCNIHLGGHPMRRQNFVLAARCGPRDKLLKPRCLGQLSNLSTSPHPRTCPVQNSIHDSFFLNLGPGRRELWRVTWLDSSDFLLFAGESVACNAPPALAQSGRRPSEHGDEHRKGTSLRRL